MSDIVERLRHWSHGLIYDLRVGLMHEAASEIARLRLTAAEREAIEWAILQPCTHVEDRDDTLLNLLERLK